MTVHHIHHPIEPDNGEHGANQRKLFIALLITTIVMIAEIIGGLLANSLALLSDAGHMLTDILSLGLSLVAMKLAQKPPTPSKTFGFHRLEILAAFFNGMLLFFMSFYIFYEAYHRLVQPEEIKGLFMLVVAFIGLLANGAGILLLRKSAHTSLNVKSAFFHIVGDTISSGGVILGGVIILYTGWYLVDPLLSIFIGLLILIGIGFETDFTLGLLTSLGVIAHELPEGVTTFALMINSMEKKTALKLSIAVGLATPLGALISLTFMKSLSQAMVGVMLAIAGGSFLYIAASDLIPETHEEKGFENSGFLLIGVISLYVLSKTIGG